MDFAPVGIFDTFFLITRILTIKSRYLKNFHSVKTWMYFDFYYYLGQRNSRNIGVYDRVEIPICIHL